MTPKSQAENKTLILQYPFLTIFLTQYTLTKNNYTFLSLNHIMRICSNWYNYAICLKLFISLFESFKHIVKYIITIY